MLGADMIKAEVALEDSEWLQYIDALQANGDIATAAETWEAQKSHLGAKEDLAESFWMTGVRLYVALGKPQKAQNLAFECYDHTTLFNPEVLVLVITAWAKSQSPTAAVKAWVCYLALRRRLEKTEDEQTLLNVLGRVSAALLEAGQHDLALAVFKDMFVLSAKSPADSWRIFQRMVEKSQGSPNPSEDIVTKVGLSSLAILPRSFQNKFFFASWIKWLLGEGKVEEAAMVVELMYERGVRPDARHLNGIVAAWFRKGSPDARQEAESTAWTMIQSRIELVQTRSPQQDADGEWTAKSQTPVEMRRTPTFLRRGAPAATIETFSILLQFYTRRSRSTEASHLTEVMTGPAQMQPNSFIMNHWLYASLRSGQYHDVWRKYSTLKQTIAPDLETFAALWDTVKAYHATPAARDGSFPDGRVLFAEMQQWFRGLDEKKRPAVVADLSPELYEQIIRSFCLSSDPAGIVCALYGLRESFDMLPHEEVTRLIVVSLARSFWSEFVAPSSRARGLRVVRQRHYQSAVKILTEIVVDMMDKKIEEDDTIDPVQIEDVESRPAQELRFDVLTSILRMVIEKVSKDPDNIEQDIMQVAQQMNISVPVDVLVHGDSKGARP
jgi:pentatricopeptide repeat protein